MDDVTYYLLSDALGTGSVKLVLKYVSSKRQPDNPDMPLEAKNILSMLKHARSENLIYHNKQGFERTNNPDLEHAVGFVKKFFGWKQYVLNGQPDFYELQLRPDGKGGRNLEVKLLYYGNPKKNLSSTFPFKGETEDLMKGVNYLQTFEGIKIGLN